jgi:hypothetical protein
MAHGGKRPGAGSKPMPPGQRRKMRSFRLSPRVVEFLDLIPDGERSPLVDRALTRAFFGEL